MVDAIFYVVRSGCAWRYLPWDVLPWQTVFNVYLEEVWGWLVEIGKEELYVARSERAR